MIKPPKFCARCGEGLESVVETTGFDIRTGSPKTVDVLICPVRKYRNEASGMFHSKYCKERNWVGMYEWIGDNVRMDWG